MASLPWRIDERKRLFLSPSLHHLIPDHPNDWLVVLTEEEHILNLLISDPL